MLVQVTDRWVQHLAAEVGTKPSLPGGCQTTCMYTWMLKISLTMVGPKCISKWSQLCLSHTGFSIEYQFAFPLRKTVLRIIANMEIKLYMNVRAHFSANNCSEMRSFANESWIHRGWGQSYMYISMSIQYKLCSSIDEKKCIHLHEVIYHVSRSHKRSSVYTLRYECMHIWLYAWLFSSSLSLIALFHEMLLQYHPKK